jgi:hypothetical protein
VRRFLLFASTVLGLLLALELVCRANPEGMAAIAHRVRFKLALLKAHGPVDTVALGSSRSNDGIGPGALDLGVAFNAAVPSTSLPTLERIVAQLGHPKLVLVEVSRPQFDAAPYDGDPAPDEKKAEGDPLGAWLTTHSALIPVRRAFAFENLPRVGGLLAAPHLDGSEWFRSRFLISMLQSDAPLVQDDAAWKPVAPPSDAPTIDDDRQRIIDGYLRVATTLRNAGAKVVLVAPPLGTLHRVEECEPGFNALRAEIARRLNAPLVDFTCAPVDDRWFLDSQHLSSPGRKRYSRALGEAVRALP